MIERVDGATLMVLQAGGILREYYGSGYEVESKGGIDLVTTADHAVEEFILGWIASRYPQDGVLAEESGGRDGTSEFRWVIDPLDGTVNFAHGLGHFSVLVALQEKRQDGFETLVSWTLDPMREELFVAQKGKGATLNGSRIRVSETTLLRQSLLCTGFGYDRLTNEADNHREFCRMNLLTRGVRRFGSAGLDLAYVACGRYDGFWERGLNPWDIAAGLLLVAEAGGVVTSVEGTAVELNVGSVLSANPKIYTPLKKALESAQEVPINSRKGIAAFLPAEERIELIRAGLEDS